MFEGTAARRGALAACMCLRAGKRFSDAHAAGENDSKLICARGRKPCETFSHPMDSRLHRLSILYSMEDSPMAQIRPHTLSGFMELLPEDQKKMQRVMATLRES